MLLARAIQVNAAAVKTVTSINSLIKQVAIMRASVVQIAGGIQTYLIVVIKFWNIRLKYFFPFVFLLLLNLAPNVFLNLIKIFVFPKKNNDQRTADRVQRRVNVWKTQILFVHRPYVLATVRIIIGMELIVVDFKNILFWLIFFFSYNYTNRLFTWIRRNMHQ